MLQAVHRQTIGFINDDKRSGIRDRFDSGLVFMEDVIVCRLEGQGIVGPVIAVVAMQRAVSFIAGTENIECSSLF